MESHGIPDCIQVCEETYQILQDKYLLEKRGLMKIKGKGEMMTYLLKGKRDNS
jgi:adenylate cyclase